ERLLGKYYPASLCDISLGQLLIDMFAIANRYREDVPTDITGFARASLTAEEIIELLETNVSIMKYIQQMTKNNREGRHTPKRTLEGRLKFNLNVEDVLSFLQRLDRISNRLSFSIILLSFSILMVGLIIGSAIAGESNLLFKLPLIELGGIVALIMFLFMLFSIFRSGRM